MNQHFHYHGASHSADDTGPNPGHSDAQAAGAEGVSAVESLCDRFPEVVAEDLLAGFVPPPHFAGARFSTYIPDPSAPSQAAALAELRTFADNINAAAEQRKGGWLHRRRRLRDRTVPRSAGELPGRYLDGGFGVGKTHLLVSLWFATEDAGRRSYGTFVEYTNLVGALGFDRTVEALSSFSLVCIDEFELDDPGDTVLMATLLSRLTAAGVRIAATSNTLPEKLGEGRFAADDFLREIQGLAASFQTIRIDGDDYRHRGLPVAPQPLTDQQVFQRVTRERHATLDRFDDLLIHLSQVHPSRYGVLVSGVELVGLTDVRPFRDQADALRFVVLVDRLYDVDAAVAASGVPVDQLFTEEMLVGGYRKKYRRAISRLVAMASRTS